MKDSFTAGPKEDLMVVFVFVFVPPLVLQPEYAGIDVAEDVV